MNKGSGVNKLAVSSVKRSWLAVMVMASLGLSACTNTSKAPADDRYHGRPAVTQGQYQVQRGDTLYRIATRNGWNWKALAALNGINAPYSINPGQIIYFDRQQAASRPIATNTTRVTNTSPPKRTTAAAKPQVVSQPSTATKKPPVVVATPPATAPTTSKTSTAAVSSKGWRWPASGRAIARSFDGKKGVDIIGSAGDPIVAAADGEVAYAGNAIVGYGELIIIQHSNSYLSAYGHNRQILVKEGQKVKSGQKIAEMGSTATDTTKLFFEIRRSGTSIDPLPFLPAR